MYINKEVDIPDSVIAAQSDGNLVIFAGAGVSMGAPSNLPSFVELASQIAGEDPSEDEENRLDWFLGRLSDEGIDVQTRARNKLNPEGTKPADLHRLLARLVGEPNNYRIVTTNFDNHFTTVFKEMGLGAENIYYAPALPIGSKFGGLVYLHGSVDRQSEDMVLTDANFGEAYLTRGWATRFLMDMFSEYTVLFVGYSYKDPVLQYVARGFVTDTKRYAFVDDEADRRHWQHYGVSPILFPLRQTSDRHGALTDAIADWNELAKRGVLDHEQRINELVKSPPPYDKVESDYIKRIIDDKRLLQFFVRQAELSEWLRWAAERKYLDGLFTFSQSPDARMELLAWWFAEKFALRYPEEALNLVYRKGQVISVSLWYALARELARTEAVPDAHVLGRWILVLINSSRPESDPHFLEQILSKYHSTELEAVIILLLSFLLQSTVRLSWSYADSQGEPGLPTLEPTIRGKEWHLRKFWDNYIIPNMEILQEALLPILAKSILEMELATGVIGGTNLNYRRWAVEVNKANVGGREWHFLIDAARDTINWLNENNSDRGRQWILLWIDARTVFLKRIAIHGLIESPAFSHDEVLGLIRNRDLLYDYQLEHETFLVLAKRFPFASGDEQGAFVQYASGGMNNLQTDSSESMNIEGNVSERQRYNVAEWLQAHAPNSEIALEYFEKVQRMFPHLSPRERPEIRTPPGRFELVEPVSPLNLEQLLDMNRFELIDILLDYHDGTSYRDRSNREGLINTVEEACRADFEWSMDLTTTLAERDFWANDVWSAILRTWQNDDQLSSGNRKWVLGFLDSQERLHLAVGADILRLLGHWLDGDVIDVKEQAQVEGLVNAVYNVAEEDRSSVISGDVDWLTVAINTIGGRAMEVWIRILSIRPENVTENLRDIPNSYRALFETIIYSERDRDVFARIVLTTHVYFLHGLNSQWVEEHLLPLFSWYSNPSVAEQSWNGFLYWGRWNEALFEAMLPYTKETFGRQESLEERRDRFCDMLGEVAAFSAHAPWPTRWLRGFISESNSTSRHRWAFAFGQSLNALSVEGRRSLWNQWIEDYWKERNTGVPRPLDEDELEAMIMWAIPLQSMLAKVVELIDDGPVLTEIGHDTFYRLNDSTIVEIQANATVHLLKQLLSQLGDTPEYVLRPVFEIAKKAFDNGAAPEDIRGIAEALAELGSASGTRLRDYVETRKNDKSS